MSILFQKLNINKENWYKNFWFWWTLFYWVIYSFVIKDFVKIIQLTVDPLGKPDTSVLYISTIILMLEIFLYFSYGFYCIRNYKWYTKILFITLIPFGSLFYAIAYYLIRDTNKSKITKIALTVLIGFLLSLGFYLAQMVLADILLFTVNPSYY